MSMMIKQSIKPQASRLSFLLIALVVLGFGALAQQHTGHASHVEQTAQSFPINK
jgi:hypothetical protein